MIKLRPVLTKWPSHLLPRAIAKASKSSVVNVKPADVDNVSSSVKISDQSENSLKKQSSYGNTKSNLVAQVFANLNDPGGARTENVQPADLVSSLPKLERSIKEAKNVETLLQIASTPNLSRKLSFRILSMLGDWTVEKKIKLSDFEGDIRFLKMCRILSQDLSATNDLGDLATVLGVTGDDEAAKLISSASLSQMVRIMEKLSAKKKRSPPLLRSLAFNISKCDEKLNVKQCADILFAMANLSFHDEVLLVKTCADAYANLTNETKSSVVGSIARSLGILRCRDTALLDRMAEWLTSQKDQARPQDIVAILMALATVDYQPSNSETFWKVIFAMLRPQDLSTSGLYLDAVWSLILLNKGTDEHMARVLSPDFITKLRTEEGSNLSMSMSLKLLNINAAAKFMIKEYKGPQLKENEMGEVIHTRSRDKTTLVSSVMDSLLNLLPGANFLKRDVPTGAGFYIDGECLITNNCTPLPVASTGKNAVRVAIMVLGYHDTCVMARFHANGVQAFSRRLLEAQGYKVLSVLHSEFSPTSKLVQRVQYLEQKLKVLVSS